jgi:hypothetical protein
MFDITHRKTSAAVVQHRWHDFIISSLKALAQSETGLLREMPAEGTGTRCHSGRGCSAQLKSLAGTAQGPMRKILQTPGEPTDEPLLGDRFQRAWAL